MIQRPYLFILAHVRGPCILCDSIPDDNGRQVHNKSCMLQKQALERLEFESYSRKASACIITKHGMCFGASFECRWPDASTTPALGIPRTMLSASLKSAVYAFCEIPTHLVAWMESREGTTKLAVQLTSLKKQGPYTHSSE
mmetsp:Transcript_57191/g.77998  ORF Transcript_57191/g.77998 Transcript_57191/m.77998 type:complete len:141 (-) Transcript_57191:28-450(-)